MESPPFFTTRDHPKQVAYAEAVFSGQYRYLLAGGAIAGGKTAITLNIGFVLCRLFPGSRLVIVRKDLPTLRRTTIPSFNQLKPNFVGSLNQTDWTATCRNGSQIIFFPESMSEDPDYNRWKGLEANWFILEEANELLGTPAQGGLATFHMAIQRVGRWIIRDAPVQPPPLILLTCNPAPGWLKDTFYDPWQAGKLAAPYYFEQMFPRDNPSLPASYLEGLEDLKESSPDQYNRYVLGLWEFPAGAVFEELRDGVHRVPPRPLTPRFRRQVSADWGTANIAPALWSETDDALDDAPRIHVYQEWGPSDMPPVRWAEGVLERSGYDLATGQWPGEQPGIERVILDSASWSRAPRPYSGVPIALQMVPVFRKAGVRLVPSVKGDDSIRWGIDLLHTYFDTYRGAMDPLLTISEACPLLWKALTRIQKGDPTKGKDRVPALNQHPLVDWCDALRYLVQSNPRAGSATPEDLAARDPLQMAARSSMDQHELRMAAKARAIDPILDPADLIPDRKPWTRARKNR